VGIDWSGCRVRVAAGHEIAFGHGTGATGHFGPKLVPQGMIIIIVMVMRAVIIV